MRQIYLIRHASPVITPSAPARDWPLSERGITEAATLGETARGWGLASLFCSSEPKARTTALIIGDAVGLSPGVVDGFDELRISEWVDNSDAFNDLVGAVLSGEPPPRGVESAEDAAARFAGGMEIVAQGAFPAAIVSHGRILTSYLSRFHLVEDAFAFWRRIPMPGWTAIDLDEPRREVANFRS